MQIVKFQYFPLIKVVECKAFSIQPLTHAYLLKSQLIFSQLTWKQQRLSDSHQILTKSLTLILPLSLLLTFKVFHVPYFSSFFACTFLSLPSTQLEIFVLTVW